jgi:hypothetical protein
MEDLASRLAHRVQLTTDGHKTYLTAVEEAFGGNHPGHYSPPECIGQQTESFLLHNFAPISFLF